MVHMHTPTSTICWFILCLQKFPHFIDISTSQTVGKLHCLHLACQSSLDMLKILMEFDYPDDVKRVSIILLL